MLWLAGWYQGPVDLMKKPLVVAIRSESTFELAGELRSPWTY